MSPSISPSYSPSISPSVSPSPSPGWNDYTRGEYAVLPTNDDDLTTAYTAQDVIDVANVDAAWVTQTATSKYSIHQYKNYATTTPEHNECFIRWTGQSSSNSNPVVLQIYNQVSGLWETLDQMPVDYGSAFTKYGSTKGFYGTSTADTDFELYASITDLTNYKNEQGVVSHRVYQYEAPS